MIKPVTYFELFCDRCGNRFDNDDYTAHADSGDALTEARGWDWWVGPDYAELDQRGPADGHYCARCVTLEWVDDETVLLTTVRPLPDPHPLDARTPYSDCRREGCGLGHRHPVHTREVVEEVPGE